jgi:hypothetical protein
LASNAGSRRPASRATSCSVTGDGCSVAAVLAGSADMAGTRCIHTASRMPCMFSVAAVVAITASCSGSTKQNCPYAPSPRYPCRDLQNWNPYPCCQSGFGSFGDSICVRVASATHSSESSRRPFQTPPCKYSKPSRAIASVVAWSPEYPMSRPAGYCCQPTRPMPSGSKSRGRRYAVRVWPVSRWTIAAREYVHGWL